MSDDHRPVRRGLALGVGLVFAATLGVLVLAPNLASARGSTRDSLTHMDASVQSITEKLSHGNFAFWDDHAHHHHGPLAGVDAVQKTADLTGTTEADVKAALQGGATLAGFAADHGISENDLVGAIVADASAHIDQAATDGKLTQSQSDDLKSGLNDQVAKIVELAGGLPSTGHGRRSDRFLDHGAAIDTTASLTGTTSDDVGLPSRVTRVWLPTRRLTA